PARLRRLPTRHPRHRTTPGRRPRHRGHHRTNRQPIRTRQHLLHPLRRRPRRDHPGHRPRHGATGRARRTVPTTDTTPNTDQQPTADHLSDIYTVLRGEKRVRTQVVLARLAELNPTEYEDWTFQDLAATLAEYDIEPAKSQGVKVVRADDVAEVLTERGEIDDE